MDYSVSVDDTKITRVVGICTRFNVIVGGVFTQHWIYPDVKNRWWDQEYDTQSKEIWILEGQQNENSGHMTTGYCKIKQSVHSCVRPFPA